MGNTTIEFRDVNLSVSYYYQPEEPEVRYYKDGSGYPGCAATLEIEKITISGVDVTLLLDDYMNDIEDLIWEKLSE